MRQLTALVCAFGAAALVTLALPGCDDGGSSNFKRVDSGPTLDGGFAPGESCKTDTDCASGHCVDLKGTQGKRCVWQCKTVDDCPKLTGWSCNNNRCECTGGARSDTCGNDGDCDGKDDHPPVPETCSGKDDDCNGKVDDITKAVSGSKTYFQDIDGDGYGNPLEVKYSCTDPGKGWTLDNSDCDDKQKDDNPGAKEICGDTRDNDCDGKIEDVDECGLRPIEVPDATGNTHASAQIKLCQTNSALDKSVDITELLAKQDKTQIRFTVRLAGAPASTACSTYKLAFGDPAKSTDDLVYILRMAKVPCASAQLAEIEAFYQGTALSPASKVVTGFSAADPGHVSFTIPKSELAGRVPDPTYRLRACTSLKADASTDLTQCISDTCEVKLHR